MSVPKNTDKGGNFEVVLGPRNLKICRIVRRIVCFFVQFLIDFFVQLIDG